MKKRISILRSTLNTGMSAFALFGLTCAVSGMGLNNASAAEGAENRTSLIEEAPAPEGTLTVALKYVTYQKEGQEPVVSDAEYGELTRGMNQLVSSCKVRFRMEEVQKVDPSQYGLSYNTDAMAELERIREPFVDDNRLVVISTGEWNHDTMGAANAWTTMPGTNPPGAVIEEPVATYANIVAHELGHYLGLDHVSDQTNLMNPVIYDDSAQLSEEQCQQMRDNAQGVWAQSLR